MDKSTAIIISIAILIGLVLFRKVFSKRKLVQEKLSENFPALWRDFLTHKVLFYSNLNDADKSLFEKRVQLFIATKTIEGIDTDIDDTIKLMVASSAIIPTFAFSKI